MVFRRNWQSAWRLAGVVLLMMLGALEPGKPAFSAVVIFDGFGDADRNNDGSVTFYDTDINDSGTWNDPTEDMGLSDRGIVEVTAAQDPADVGIVWSGIRSYDTAANIAKSRLRIINDDVPTGVETASDIHNDGLALGVESRGGGGSFIGRFGQSIELGPEAGDKVVVSVDFRVWRESANPTDPLVVNELRWGLFQDTDEEFGATGPYGEGWAINDGNGEVVEWGKDDGKWFNNEPGAEGDKGIYTRIEFGNVADPSTARINWEHNIRNINGTFNNGRLMEGSGVSDTPGTGGDVGTVASPPNDGPGGIITDLTTFEPHKLSMEIVRLADGLVEIASFVDDVEILRDSITMDSTGFGIIGPPADSFDYVGFRNSSGDYDYAIDNFMLEVIGSNEPGGVLGDYNGNGTVDAADYTLWRDNLGSTTPLANGTGGTVGQADYELWKENFGDTSGAGASLGPGAVPEPAAAAIVVIGALLATGTRRRGFADRA